MTSPLSVCSKVPQQSQEDRGVLARRLASQTLLLCLLCGTVANAIPEGPPGTTSGDSGKPLAAASSAADVSLFTGAVTADIPITVPPGRNGMQPNMALRYSSQNGDDAYMGVGWSLPLGRVERLRREGVPSFTDSDGFVVFLPDRVVELSSIDVDRFAALIDEQHAEVTRTLSGGEWVWTLSEASGRSYVFGETPTSRVGRGSGAQRFAWYLTRIEDHNGNWIGINYDQEGGLAYPTSVAWGANTHGIAAHRYAVSFVWTTRMSVGATTPLSYGAGFRQEQIRLLDSARVGYYPSGVAPGATEVPIRRYDLTWGVSTRTLRPLLQAVQLYGYDEGGADAPLRRGVAQEPAPWSFAYLGDSIPAFEADGTWQQVPFPTFRNQDCDGTSWPCDKTRDFIDLNGDGRPEAIKTGNFDPVTNPNWDIWPNDGISPYFQTMTPWASPDKEMTRTGEDGTKVALLDVIGRDGRPDYVVTRPTMNRWDIYANTGDGFAAAIPASLDGGHDLIQVRLHDDSCQVCPVLTAWDLADLNGDGFPDRIGTANWEDTRTWDVWWGQGDGTWAQGSIVSPLKRIREGSRHVRHDLFDINGDGLPDLVDPLGDISFNDHWKVWYGTGSGFVGTNGLVTVDGQGQLQNADPIEWSMPLDQGDLCVDTTGPWDCGYPFTRDVYINPNNGRSLYVLDMVDLTGDGLPDQLATNDSQWGATKWFVRRNTGQGFTFWEEWSLGLLFRRSVVPDPSKPSLTGLRYDLFDISGDGYPDHITIDPDTDRISVAYGRAATDGTGGFINGPIDGLVWMRNPVGATTEITYAVANGDEAPLDQGLAIHEGVDLSVPHMPSPVWVASSIDREAGALLTTYTFAGGYYDPKDRAFRGFNRVTVEPPAGGYETTFFHQTKALAGKPYRKVVHYWEYDESGAYDEYSRLKEEHWTWEVDMIGSLGRRSPKLKQTQRTDFTNDLGYLGGNWFTSGAGRTTTSEFDYDACGNITNEKVWDGASGTGLLAKETTAIFYLNDCDVDDRICSGQCDRVDTLEVLGGLKKKFTYNTRGDLETVEFKRSDQTIEFNPKSYSFYDSLGNLTTSIDLSGRSTTYTYDPDTQIFLQTTTADDGGIGEVTTTYVDHRFGRTSQRIDPAGAETDVVFDDFGRIEKEIAPGDDEANPTKSYTYFWPAAGSGGTQRIERRTREPSSLSGQRVQVDYFDLLGRPLQQQETRTIAGGTVTVVTGATRYVATSGLVARVYEPKNIGAQYVTAFYDGFVPGTDPAAYQTYDPFGRVSEQIAADGSTVSMSYDVAWTVRTCDASHNADPVGGQCAEEERDVLDRVVATRTYVGAATGSSYATKHARHYDADGTVAWEEQNDTTATRLSYQYDSLNRLTQKTDPDTGGPRTYRYDTAGNIRCDDDPEAGQFVWLAYDDLQRLIRREQRTGSCPDPGVFVPGGSVTRCAEFIYYTPADEVAGNAAPFGVGRLKRTASYACGCGECSAESKREFGRYHPRGMVEEVTETIIGPVGGVRNYTTTYTYDAAGRLKTRTFPFMDTQDEVLEYRFASDGRPSRVLSQASLYIDTIEYDERSRATEFVYGSGLVDTATFWPADSATVGKGNQLDHMTTAAADGTVLRDSWHTGYSPNGFVTAVYDVTPGHALGTPLYNGWGASYDDRGRLRSWTRYDASGAANDYDYDDFGNIILKDGKTYWYQAFGPHQVEQIGTETLDYDSNGNMMRLPGDRYAKYDGEGRLVMICQGSCDVTSPVVQATYGYDAEGRRVWAKTGSTTTLFFEGFELDVNAQVITRHVTAGGRVVASTSMPEGQILTVALPARRSVPPVMLARGVAGVTALGLLGFVLFGSAGSRRRPRLARGSVGTVVVAFFVGQLPHLPVAHAGCDDPTTALAGTTFYHVDRLGSTELLTDASGSIVEYVRSQPYGAVTSLTPQGVPKSSADSTFQFTGHRGDDGTGLYYFPARFYDPGIGTFVSHDPGDVFFSPYSYIGGNPLAAIDPDGANPFVIGFLVTALAGIGAASLATFVDSLVQGADFDAAISASASSVGYGVASVGAGLALAGPAGAAFGAVGAQVALSAVNAGLSTYGAVRSFQDGNFSTGLVAVAGAGLSLYGLYESGSALIAANGGGNSPARSGVTFAEMEQLYGAKLTLAGSRYRSWSDYLEVRAPDYDGYLTLGEARWQWGRGAGAPVMVEAGQLDFSGLHIGDFSGVGSQQAYTFQNWQDFLVHGTVLTQLHSDQTISVVPNTYDFDVKAWRYATFSRNLETIGAHVLHGGGIPFQIRFWGRVPIAP